VRSLSLVSTGFVWSLAGATATSFAVLATRRVGQLRLRRFVVALAAAIATSWIAWWWLAAHNTFRPAPPPSLIPWAALLVAAPMWLAAGWRQAHLEGRLLGGVGVVLAGLTTASAVNAYYGYYPTLGALLGKTATHQATPSQLLAHVTQVLAGHERPPAAGRSVKLAFPNDRSGFGARAGWVYVPPAWFSRQRPRLPVVVVLHGTPGGPDDMLRGGLVDQVADSWAASHGGQAPILVMPDINGSAFGDTECVDTARSKPESFLTADLRGFVVDRFGADPDPARWAVAGFSEGGTCALHLALRHPEAFRSFVDIGGEAAPALSDAKATLRDLFGGSATQQAAYDPTSLLRSGRFEGGGAWFASAKGDRSLLEANRRLADLATKQGADAHFVTLPGAHTFPFFRQAFTDSFPWLNARLSAPPTPMPRPVHKPAATPRGARP